MSRVSGYGLASGGGASAGEIRGDAVHAESERELAAVVQVGFEDVPDDPGAREVDDLAVPVVLEGLLHVVGAPAGQAIGHHVPGEVEALHQLVGGAGGRVGLVPACGRFDVRTGIFAEDESEPAG